MKGEGQVSVEISLPGNTHIGLPGHGTCIAVKNTIATELLDIPKESGRQLEKFIHRLS
jgi:hypothetical protein